MGKRFWLGIALLSLLLALGAGSALVLEKLQVPVARELRQAGELAKQAQWSQAEALADHAQAQWKRWRPLTAVFADHTPLEEIDSAFSSLEIYLEDSNMLSFQAASRELGAMVDAVWEAQALRWWSFL